MFNLIISIIAIALVVALATATLYYGGDAFNKGTEEAQVAAINNQVQQIQGAWVLHKVNTGGEAANMAALVGDYLSAAPNTAYAELAAWEITPGTLATDPDVLEFTADSNPANDGYMPENICNAIDASPVVSCVYDGTTPGSEESVVSATL